MKPKLKLKKKWINLFIDLIMIICLVILAYSVYNIATYKYQENEVKDEIQTINDNSDVVEVEDTEDTEVIKQEEQLSESDPYWDYINMNLIDVDFSALKEINSHVKGWIQVNGTNINYPFVQGYNNDYYLTHSFDRSTNIGGWVFLDYRNKISNFNDKNTIIYAHGMHNNTMFGTLRNILKSGWLNNSDNYVVKLSTEYENTLWQVFSVYRIPTTSDYLQIDFSSTEEFKNFADMLKNRSAYDFNTTVSEDDRILTLSTCYDDNDKVVLHAKLIKRETK